MTKRFRRSPTGDLIGIKVYFDPPTHRALKDKSQKEERSISQMVNIIVRKALEK